MSNTSSMILQKSKRSLAPEKRNIRKTFLVHIQNMKIFTIGSFLGKIFIECIDGFLKNSLLCLHLFEVYKHRFHLRLILHKKLKNKFFCRKICKPLQTSAGQTLHQSIYNTGLENLVSNSQGKRLC